MLASGRFSDFDPDFAKDVDYSKFLTMDNYAAALNRLLWLEEIQMEMDIKMYDLEDTKLQREGRYFKLHVPGLAENRPSVLRGDKILVSADGESKFSGIVQSTSQEYAILEFPGSFSRKFIEGIRVDVRFTFSSTGLRTSHQALASVKAENSLHSKPTTDR